jgi:hypothetical protein
METMTRWAAITIVLYLALIFALYFPLAFLLCGSSMEGAVDGMATWPYWLVMSLLAISQVLLLVVPVKSSSDIQLKKRHLLAPLLGASLLMAILLAGIVVSIAAIPLGDSRVNSLLPLGLGVVSTSWIIWFLVFRRYYRGCIDQNQLMVSLRRSLVKGSIAELLVAVSSHIVVRVRGDCSASLGTFFGIMAGLAVMLCAFGPGTFYLFAARRRRMLPRSKRQ